MKVAHIGSKSVHVQHFVAALNDNQSVKNILVAEESCAFNGVEKELVVSYRKLSIGIIRQNKRKIRAFLQTERPDVLHIHQLNRLAYFVEKVAKSLQIPIISTAWGSDVLLVPKQNILFKWLVQQTIKRSKIVTADAEIMIEAMKALVPSDVRYQKIQYGIDPVESNSTKGKIIFSNRLHKPLYRIDQVVRYFADFHASFPEYTLVVGATGDDTEMLKNLVSSLGLEENVMFVGWLTDAQNRSWYAKSEYYISIPSSDGTSVSLLEAISAKCIPIVSDLPANREWVEDAKTGVVEQEGINPLMRVKTMQLSEGCEQNAMRVIHIASRKHTIPQFISYYEQCING